MIRGARSFVEQVFGWNLYADSLTKVVQEQINEETDLVCAMAALDEWIDKLPQNGDNVDPNEIPWDALHKMLVQFVYGS